MDAPEPRRFIARYSQFTAIRAYVDEAGAALDGATRQRVVLLLEELFTNTVQHGYGGECDHPVWVTVTAVRKACRITYEDAAPMHDPFAEEIDSNIEADVEDRPVGSLGVFLLEEMSSSHRYERREGRNVVVLEVPRGRAGSAGFRP